MNAITCGTSHGYRAHRRRGEDCDKCRRAQMVYQQAQRAKKKGARTRDADMLTRERHAVGAESMTIADFCAARGYDPATRSYAS
jgi:hypothetical protein